MLQILGRPDSLNVRKVLWTCVELQLPYSLQLWGRGFQSPEEPEFLALNPNALVPVIRDGDFVLWESNSICRYLAARYGSDDLLPAAPQARAQVEQWMDWQATELNNAWRYAFMALVRQSPAYTSVESIAMSVLHWNHNMGILEAQLERTGAYVVGEQFTLADIVVGLSTHRWLMTPIDRVELPAVSAYYERLCLRPGFLQHGCNGSP